MLVVPDTHESCGAFTSDNGHLNSITGGKVPIILIFSEVISDAIYDGTILDDGNWIEFLTQ